MPYELMVQINEKLDRIEQHLMANKPTGIEHILERTLSRLEPADIDRLHVLLQQECPVCHGHTIHTTDESPPEHVTIAWVIGYLQVSRATFYRSIKDKLLSPVLKVGNRPYYLKSDVTALLAKHEKGSWTFSKMAKLKEKTSKKVNTF